MEVVGFTSGPIGVSDSLTRRFIDKASFVVNVVNSDPKPSRGEIRDGVVLRVILRLGHFSFSVVTIDFGLAISHR